MSVCVDLVSVCDRVEISYCRPFPPRVLWFAFIFVLPPAPDARSSVSLSLFPTYLCPRACRTAQAVRATVGEAHNDGFGQEPREKTS